MRAAALVLLGLVPAALAGDRPVALSVAHSLPVILVGPLGSVAPSSLASHAQTCSCCPCCVLKVQAWWLEERKMLLYIMS